MKILKRCLAVLGVACMLFMVAIPCFAWEWNGDVSGLLTSPIAPIEYEYLSVAPTFGDISNNGNSFTSKGSLLTLALPDSFGIDSVLSQGDNNDITVYGANAMLFTNKTDAIATVQRIWDTEYDSGESLTPLRQLADCSNVAQIQYTYGGLSYNPRYLGSRVSSFGTHVDLLPWILAYQTYSLTSDNAEGGLTCHAYFRYKTLEGDWKNDMLVYEGYDSRIFIENDTRDYYQYNIQIGRSLKEYVTTRPDYDAQQPFVIVESMYIGNTAEQGPFRAIRCNNLVGVHDSFAGSGIDPTLFSINGGGGNMLANMLFSGYVSNKDIPPNAIPPELNNATSFLSSALGGFMNFSIVPGITLGGILATVLCISMFLVFLKVFAGG